MTQWLADKIANFLIAREGCQVLEAEDKTGGNVIVLQDSMGFFYEIRVTRLGRIGENHELHDKHSSPTR